MSFMKNLKETVNDEKQLTENGAVGYRTTGKKLLDLNFSVSSLRNMPENLIVSKFSDAFYEDKALAVKWLFFLGDIRQGLGERRSFRTIMKYLADSHPKIAKAVLHLVPDYSRWDYVLDMMGTSLQDDAVTIVKNQLSDDMEGMRKSKPISLLAKWMPSENATSPKTVDLANKMIGALGIKPSQYRKMLSALRAYLDVVERKMSANQWSEIDYSKVPSKANLIYNDAFIRNDEERRREYLNHLKKGEVKINASVLFPHDIVNSYKNKRAEDSALEAMWKALPDYVKEDGGTICVADGSGSMSWAHLSSTHVTALDVANGLAIYFSERCSGEFKDTYITFSSRPQLVDLSGASSLKQKLEIAYRHCECSNTNIEAVFNLILDTAVRNKMRQEDLPKNVLVLSDMEFDGATTGSTPSKTLFNTISDKFKDKGYSMPRLIFWNICGRTGTIPVKENDAGVALVSGFSPVITKMVLSNETDPFKCLLEQLNVERYQPVEDAIKNVI